MRMKQCYLRIALRARSASGLLDALGLGYDLPVGQAVYAIDAFPDDDLLWRIEWIGGLITRAFRANRESMFAWRSSLLARRTHSAPDRGAPLKRKRTVKIDVGLISIASVWQKRRPVVTDLAAYRYRLRIDTTSCRMVALGELTSSHNAIPRSNYLFGPSLATCPPNPPGRHGAGR